MTIHENKQLPRVLPPAGNHTPLFYFHTSSRHGLAFQQAFQGVKVLKDDMRAYSKGYLAAALAGCAATAFAQESQQRLAVVVPAYVGDLDRAVSSLGRWPSTCSTITQQNVDLVLYYAEGEEDAAAVDAAAATVAATAGRCFSKTLTVYAHLSEEVRGESTFRREEFISKVKRKGSHPPAYGTVFCSILRGFRMLRRLPPLNGSIHCGWLAFLSRTAVLWLFRRLATLPFFLVTRGSKYSVRLRHIDASLTEVGLFGGTGRKEGFTPSRAPTLPFGTRA